MVESKFVIEVDDRRFDQEVLARSQQTPVLVDFWASWCAPCRTLGPVLEKLSGEYGGAFLLAKVNTDENQQLATQCGVRSLPTVLLVSQGQIVDGFVGAQPEAAIKALLQRRGVQPAAPGEEEPLPQPAVEVKDRQEAIRQLRARLDSEPDNHALHAQLAGLLIADGDYDAAAEVLDRLPAEKRDDKEIAALRVHVRFGQTAAAAPDSATLEQRLAERPEDSEARYLLGIRQAVSNQHESALDTLLDLVRRDRQYGDDAARKAIIDIFALLGGAGPVVKQYRSRLSASLN